MSEFDDNTVGRNRYRYSRISLPHFDSGHTIQHISYRLRDSIPLGALGEMRAAVTAQAVKKGDSPELRQLIEAYLDAGHGSCLLRNAEAAACVVDTWFRFDEERYRLFEWVVMPNHCHVMVEPLGGFPLAKIVLSWKNYTARRINQIREYEGFRHSQVWQRDYWDRFIRNEHHYIAAREYIRMNPVKAGLVRNPEDWHWSSANAGLVERCGRRAGCESEADRR